MAKGSSPKKPGKSPRKDENNTGDAQNESSEDHAMETPKKRARSEKVASSGSKSKKRGSDKKAENLLADKEGKLAETETPKSKSKSSSTDNASSVSKSKKRKADRKAEKKRRKAENLIVDKEGKSAETETPKSKSKSKTSSTGSTGTKSKSSKKRKARDSNADSIEKGENGAGNKDVEDNSQNDEHDQGPKDGQQISKPAPVMDVQVHRIRNLNYVPKPIVCLRAMPSPLVVAEDDSNTFLALSRENGSVELKAPNEKFRTIAEIAGYRQKVVNCMAWTCGVEPKAASSSTLSTSTDNNPVNATTPSISSKPVLVGGSRDGTLFVVDFASGVFRGMTASRGGAVFSLVSLCQNHAGSCNCGSSNKAKACSQLLAAGCEDGSIRIFKVIPEDSTLQLVSILPLASGGSILSLAWRKNADNKGTVLYAGVSDGTIRRYDSDDTITSSDSNTTSSGSWRSRLRMTVESLGRNTPTRVWTLQALSDGTVISGDSLGHVQFWDGATGTLLQSFDQNDSKADVLEVAVSANECKVFGSGIDSRVICIERPTTGAATAAKDEERKWILTQAQRPHTHDVKAITICRQSVEENPASHAQARLLPAPPNGNSHEVLCTGGVDTKLCTYYVEGFKKLRPQSLYPWPTFSPVGQAKDARIVMIRREGQIDLHKLNDTPSSLAPLKEAYSVPEDKTQIGIIELDSPCNIVCAAISDDGRYLAACDTLSLYIFRLEYVSEGTSISIVPSRLSLDSKSIKASVLFLKFGSNDKLFAATSDGSLHIVNMPGVPEDGERVNDTCSHAATLNHKDSVSHANDVWFPVQSLEFSKNKRWFATFQGGLSTEHISIYSRSGDDTDHKHWWTLPSLERPATSVKFLDASRSPVLIVSCSNFAFYTFDVHKRQLTRWSQKNGVPVSTHLPDELKSRNDYPIRIACNPASPSKILLVSCFALEAYTSLCFLLHRKTDLRRAMTASVARRICSLAKPNASLRPSKRLEIGFGGIV